jgi:repressor LexA
MARALTRRQREVFDFLAAHIAEKGYAPSLAEIGERFQLASLATVHKHMQVLVEKGWIRRLWNRSRSAEIVPQFTGERCDHCGQLIAAKAAVA